ncbi:MAG: Holliday junction resolvase RuvX [Deltaproteobacteria bacterium]|nr:Holliday junction resolvase RuvX [Deltaproteobacteria bacterium]
MRALGLDIGSKRIGVALSDQSGIIAQALETISSTNPQRDLLRLLEIVRDYEVTEIVIGVPYNMDGSEGQQVEKVRKFKDLIAENVTLPVYEWDERLTTVAAERALLEADMSRAKRRKIIDKVAAALILQGHLDRRRNEALFES